MSPRTALPARLGLLALLTLALGCTPARAQPRPADYDFDAERWNGVGYLQTTADEARVELVLAPELDLSALEPEDVVILFYPTTALPLSDLLDFVASGGYLVVADDRGTSAPLLEAVGISRRADGPMRHLAQWDDQEGFYVVRPAGEHFLFFNVDEVITNYPAALTLAPQGVATHEAPLTPILSFEGGREHLVVEAALGGGKLIAIADPSVFLNDMLRRFYGNKQFAANVLRYPCQREPCKARVVLPGTPFTGRFDRERARLGSLPKEIEAAVRLVNELLAEVSRAAAEPPWAPWWAVAAAALGLALTWRLLVFGRARLRALPGASSGARGARGDTRSSPALDEARGLVAQRTEADFGALATTLAEATLELARRGDLEAHARAPDVGDPPDADGHRAALRAALHRIGAEAAGLRASPPPLWSAERFLRLHDDVRLVRAAARDLRRASRRAPPASR